MVARLHELHEWARSEGLSELAGLFAVPGDASAKDIGPRVLAALELTARNPEYAVVTKQLERLALNLKNLKQP